MRGRGAEIFRSPANDVISHVRTGRHQLAGPVRPVADRTHQRLVLRAAQPGARRHLRHAQHHQLHARRAVHAGRVRRILSLALCRTGLLVGDNHHLYGLLLTFGLALIFEGTFRNFFGSSGLPYSVPPTLQGGQNLGFMFLPNYRAWVVVFSLAVCLTTWFVIERTKLGSYLRAATENPTLVRAFGINVPRMITLTYGFGVALAALAGVMAAPIYNVSPHMGAIVTGFGLGIIEGLTKVFFPEASNTVIFIIMAIVLLIRPAGLFGRSA